MPRQTKAATKRTPPAAVKAMETAPDTARRRWTMDCDQVVEWLVG